MSYQLFYLEVCLGFFFKLVTKGFSSRSVRGLICRSSFPCVEVSLSILYWVFRSVNLAAIHVSHLQIIYFSAILLFCLLLFFPPKFITGPPSTLSSLFSNILFILGPCVLFEAKHPWHRTEEESNIACKQINMLKPLSFFQLATKKPSYIC